MVERVNHKQSSVLAGALKKGHNKGAPEERAGPTIPTVTLMETDSGIGWPFLEKMVERVCSSSTGETKMAQTWTKRAIWRPSTSSGSRPSQEVAFGPYCQSDSRKRCARPNSWNEDRIFFVVAATHTETLSVRVRKEPLPCLRLIRMKNRTLSLLLLLIYLTNGPFFWKLTPSLHFKCFTRLHMRRGVAGWAPL